MSKENQGPEETIRDGFLKATIWKNEGEKGPYFTVSVAKTYEKDGELRDGHSFSGQDLLPLAELMRRAYGRVRGHQATAARIAAEPTA